MRLKNNLKYILRFSPVNSVLSIPLTDLNSSEYLYCIYQAFIFIIFTHHCSMIFTLILLVRANIIQGKLYSIFALKGTTSRVNFQLVTFDCSLCRKNNGSIVFSLCPKFAIKVIIILSIQHGQALGGSSEHEEHFAYSKFEFTPHIHISLYIYTSLILPFSINL